VWIRNNTGLNPTLTLDEAVGGVGDRSGMGDEVRGVGTITTQSEYWCNDRQALASAGGPVDEHRGQIYKTSYDNLTIMPKLRSTYDRRLIYKTSYNE